MNCTRCHDEIKRKQPYARTKRGPHHFRKSDCHQSAQEQMLEEIRVAAVKYCHKKELNYTLGTMNEMALFAYQIAREARYAE